MTALYVKMPPAVREAEDQTTRPVLVIRIIFYDLSVRYGFPYFLDADTPNDRLIGSVFGKLEPVLCNLLESLRSSSCERFLR